MSRRKKTGGINLALVGVTVASLAAAVVQQKIIVRLIDSPPSFQRHSRSDEAHSSSRSVAPVIGSPRWTASGSVSPVLPQHPHADTSKGPRRAHIV